MPPKPFAGKLDSGARELSLLPMQISQLVDNKIPLCHIMMTTSRKHYKVRIGNTFIAYAFSYLLYAVRH